MPARRRLKRSKACSSGGGWTMLTEPLKLSPSRSRRSRPQPSERGQRPLRPRTERQPMEPAGTEKLTAALAAGNEDAVETFYRRYFDWLYAQARRATRRDESFCLDVVQDAVLRIMR